MSLWNFSARELRSRPGRMLLTTLSIVIGVAAVVSVGLATHTARRAYEQMYQTLTGRADLEVTARSTGGFDSGIFSTLEETPGVAAAAPLIQRPTILYFAGERVKALAMGVEPGRDPKVRDYEIVEGMFLDEGQGVVLDSDFAKGLGAKVGDEVKLLSRRGLVKRQVIGLFTPRGAQTAFSQGVLVLNIADAARLFATGGKIDSVQLVLADAADPAEVQQKIQAALPENLSVEPPAGRTQLADETMKATQQGLNLASALSLVVAVFIIVNTFLMNVSERRRQIGILRAIGATRGQVVGLLVREGLLIGLVGTAIGILFGLGGAFLITRAMAQMFQTTLPAVEVSAGPLILGVCLGVGVTLVAVGFPARKAGRISPLEAMGGAAVANVERPGRLMPAIGLILWVVTLAVQAAAIFGYLPYISMIPAAMISLIAIALLLPVVLGPVCRMFGALLQPFLHVEGRLAERQLLRQRTRTTLTIGVLFVAITTGVGLGTTIVNNTQDVDRWFDRSIAGDFFVRAMMPDMTTGVAADLPQSLHKEIEDISGIKKLRTVQFISAEAAGESVIVITREFYPDDPMLLDLRSGDIDGLRERLVAGEVVIGTVLAQRAGLKLGDQLTLETNDGPKRLPIAGLANDYAAGGLVVYMQRDVAQRLLDVGGADAYVVTAEPGRVDEVESALSALVNKHGLILQSYAELHQAVDSMKNGVVASLWGLLVVAFVAASFGIANTLTMNVLEQTRELGLLRVVAMTRRQVRKMIMSQAAMIALIGLVPGTLVGVVLAYLVNLSTRPVFGRAIEFELHFWLVGGCFLLAYGLVMAAAWLPAQRAARLDLVDALKYE